MAEINLSTKWVDNEEEAYVFLLDDLLTEYQGKNTCTNTKTVVVGIVGDLDNNSTSWKQCPLRIMSFESWHGFSKWCKEQGICVSAKKKVVDGSKIWWPSLIEINAGSDNERLFLSKLRHL